MVSLAPVVQVFGEKDVASLGMTYSKFVLRSEQESLLDVDLDIVAVNTTSYCLLLPYVLPKQKFEKQFAVIYDDWDSGSLDGQKVGMKHCNYVFEI